MAIDGRADECIHALLHARQPCFAITDLRRAADTFFVTLRALRAHDLLSGARCCRRLAADRFGPVTARLVHHVRDRTLYLGVGEIRISAVRRHLAEYGFGQFTAAIDTDRTAAKYARAKVTPTAVLVDSHGSIRYRGRINNLYASLGRPRQQVTEHDLNNALDAVLTGQPVVKPETQALGCYIVDPAVLRK